MKITELFKRPKSAPQPAAATEWLGVEVPPPVVRRYFKQHAEDELDVPLAIAHYRRCLDEEPDKESHRANALRGFLEAAQKYEQMFKWFADEEEEGR
jgi:hypothetical protein